MSAAARSPAARENYSATAEPETVAQSTDRKRRATKGWGVDPRLISTTHYFACSAAYQEAVLCGIGNSLQVVGNTSYSEEG
jgi:hypothetical protein